MIELVMLSGEVIHSSVVAVRHCQHLHKYIVYFLLLIMNQLSVSVVNAHTQTQLN